MYCIIILYDYDSLIVLGNRLAPLWRSWEKPIGKDMHLGKLEVLR